MRRLAESLFIVTLLAAQPLLAQFTETEADQVVVLPLSGEVDAGTMARVVTGGGRPAECLAPLAVTRIDGEARSVSAKGFLIEPGLHTINGRATLDLTHCPIDDPGLMIGNAADLEVDFVAGSTYFIGYYHPPDRPGEWKLVVWNIEAGPVAGDDEQVDER